MTIIDKPIEKHPFDPFIPENATTLIVGSFPGRDQTQLKEVGTGDNDQWFYGAKRNLFWKIISSVYNVQLTCKDDKQNLFSKYGIAVTDIYLRVQRIKETNFDTDLHIVENNEPAIRLILQNHKISTILFTSKFVEERFLAMFPDAKNYACLLSPSPSANKSIFKSGAFVNFKKDNPNSNTIDFRVYQYKQLLKV